MTFRFTLLLALGLLSFSAQAQLQKINTMAGNGYGGYGGDGASAVGASLWGPSDVVLDTNLNVYILDYNNYRIRKVTVSGIITTVAGTGTAGNSGNGSLGTSADISPNGIAFDRRGNLYFSDASNNIIRKVDRYGIITQYAGGGPVGASITYGYTGDGGKADTARFYHPQGIAVDDTGNLFVADAGNHVVRRIDTFGHIRTIAGNGIGGYIGGNNDSVATAAELDSPYAVAVDRYHNVFINDYKNGVIREVRSNDTIYTVVGSPTTPGLQGYYGDGSAATTALLHDARGLGVDTAGNLYIADAVNSVIRKVNMTTGIISTVVGNGSQGFFGDLGFALGCNLYNPYGVAVDKYGDIYVADANNERIRKTYVATAGVQNVTAGTGISVYPNPFVNEITISGLSESDKVTVFDITGREINKWEATATGTHVFSTGQLPAGIYIMQVTDNEGARKEMLKMVKE